MWVGVFRLYFAASEDILRQAFFSFPISGVQVMAVFFVALCDGVRFSFMNGAPP